MAFFLLLNLNCHVASYISVVPKLVPTVTEIKALIMSYYLRYFAVIAHNTEQSCGFGSASPTKESDITPWV